MHLSVQIDTMRSKLIFYFWIFLITGEFSVGKAGMEGPSLILHSGQKCDQIFWKFEKWIIASCRENETPWCKIKLQTDEQINTFKGRLKIDDNGSLTINFTINNFSSKQAGLYTLQTINKSNKSDEKKFNVSVYPPKTAIDSESSSCSECVCQCSVMNVTRVTLSWNPSSTAPFLEVEYQDTSENSCVVNNSVTDQTKQDCQCMSPRSDSGLDPGYIALICVLVVLVGGAAAAAVIYKRRKEGRNEAVPGTMQEAEPLPVDTECAYRYEKENGTVSSIKSRPEERRSLRINGEL